MSSAKNPKVGDVGTRYRAFIEGSDCDRIDMTGGSVQFHFQYEGGVDISVTGTVGPTQVGDLLGEVYYDVLPADGVHDSAGIMHVYATATTAGGAVFNTDTVKIFVEANGPPVECC